jgi:hypothetical protein
VNLRDLGEPLIPTDEQSCLAEREPENFNQAVFALAFSPSDKIENCSAQFFAVCWVVHIEFKVHRLRDGFSVGNALLLDQSLPAFIGHNLDKIGDGTPDAIQ